jgi:hypothetical protein
VKHGKLRESGRMPKDAVLLIPQPEEGEVPTRGVKPGYYNPKQMLALIESHRQDAEAIQFIADMLETGDVENDGFAQMLRVNRQNPAELKRIVAICHD